jgi:hypothetical protein
MDLVDIDSTENLNSGSKKQMIDIDSVSDSDNELDFHNKVQKLQSKQNQIEFGDFLEPHLIKTGHIIPVDVGHNGNLTKIQLTLYEIHLQNSGFFQDFSEDMAANTEDEENDALDVTQDPMDEEY